MKKKSNLISHELKEFSIASLALISVAGGVALLPDVVDIFGLAKSLVLVLVGVGLLAFKYYVLRK